MNSLNKLTVLFFYKIKIGKSILFSVKSKFNAISRDTNYINDQILSKNDIFTPRNSINFCG